jgi:hypothetical protein
MATNISSIGSEVSRDYSTISGWESATDNDLVTAGDIEVGEMYADSDFAGNFGFTGATTDSSNYRILRAASGHRYDIADGSGAVIVESGAYGLQLSENYARLIGFGIEHTGSQNGIYQNTNVDGALFDGLGVSHNGSSTIMCLRMITNVTTDNTVVRNSIFVNIGTTSSATRYVIRDDGTGREFENCVVDGRDDATFCVGRSAGSPLCTNVAAFNALTAAFTGESSSSNYCYDDDGTATGANSLNNQTPTDDFTDPANEDYTLSGSGSACVDAGTTLTGHTNGDYVGTTRTGTWEIGAYDGYVTGDITGSFTASHGGTYVASVTGDQVHEGNVSATAGSPTADFNARSVTEGQFTASTGGGTADFNGRPVNTGSFAPSHGGAYVASVTGDQTHQGAIGATAGSPTADANGIIEVRGDVTASLAGPYVADFNGQRLLYLTFAASAGGANTVANEYIVDQFHQGDVTAALAGPYVADFNGFVEGGDVAGSFTAALGTAFSASVNAIQVNKVVDFARVAGATRSSLEVTLRAIVVNTSSIGTAVGRDYVDIASWDAATNYDLVTAEVIEVGILYPDSDFGAATVGGATTSAAAHRILRSPPCGRYDLITDTGAKIVSVSSVGFGVSNEDFFEAVGFGIEQNASGSALSHNGGGATEGACVFDGLSINATVGSAYAGLRTTSGLLQTEPNVIRNCIFHQSVPGTSDFCRIHGPGTSAFTGWTIENTVMSSGGAANSFSGGASGANSLILIKNTAAFGSTANDLEFFDAVNSDYNYSEDGTATGANSKPNQTPADDFTDPAGFDYTANGGGGELVDAGDTLTGHQWGDIIGATRTGTWDIGAYEEGALAPHCVAFSGTAGAAAGGQPTTPYELTLGAVALEVEGGAATAGPAFPKNPNTAVLLVTVGFDNTVGVFGMQLSHARATAMQLSHARASLHQLSNAAATAVQTEAAT